MKSLDTSPNYSAENMLNNAVKAVSSKYKTIQEAVDAMVKSCRAYNSSSGDGRQDYAA